MKKITLLFLAILFLHLLLLALTKFTAWPEMLAWPYFITKGWLPYRDIAIAHTPLLIFDLSLFYKIFGVGVWQIKAYAWLLILATDLTVFVVVKKLVNLKTAFLALLVYIPLQLFYDGNGLWFDYALAPLALLTFYFVKKQRYVWAGVLWGLAFFTKQTAFWFLPGITFLFLGKDLWHKVKEFSVGVLIPTAILFTGFLALGILPNFLYWAFEFGIGILPKAVGQISLPSVKTALVALLPFTVVLAGVRRDWKKFLPFCLFAVVGLMGVYPRWELFHFQPALPFLAIIISMILISFKTFSKFWKGVALIFLAGIFFLAGRTVVRNWRQSDRFLEPSVIKTAKIIKSQTKSGDNIFILNSWDSLYALADRMPATKPWIPQLPWLYSLPNVEKSVSGDLLSTPPALVVMQPYTKEGLSSFKPKKVTDVIFNYYSTDKIVDNTFWILKPYK